MAIVIIISYKTIVEMNCIYTIFTENLNDNWAKTELEISPEMDSCPTNPKMDPKPSDKEAVKRSTAFAQYHRRFIRNFAELTATRIERAM